MRRDQPLVSVIIPNYNHGEFIGEAVESVINQTFKELEIIIVDGGSTSAETLAVLHTIKNERVRIFFREGRHLVGSNRNFGIARARGGYICCVDADDTIERTYIEKAYFLAEAGGIDVISTSVERFGARNEYWDISEQPTLERLLTANDVCVSAFFRKSKWDEIGGYFDTGIGRDLVAEDWDFWIRLAAAGATFWNISRERLLRHREHDGPSLGCAPENPSWAEQLVKIKSRNIELLTPGSVDRSMRINASRKWNPDVTVNARCEANDRTCMIFVPWLLVGGAERMFSRLCTHLQSLGWTPIMVCTKPVDEEDASSSRHWFDELNIPVFCLPDFLPQPLYGPFIKHLLRSRSPRMTINGGSRLLYELSGEVRREHPNIHTVDFLFNPVGHTASHLEFQHNFDEVFAESEAMRKWYADHGWPEGRIRTLALGVDLDSFQPHARPAEIVESEALSPDEVVVGYIGRMSFEKGPMQFIEVADRLAHHPGLKFLMAGDGSQLKLVKAAVESVGNVERLRYLGVLQPQEVARLLNACDILVVPSRHDGRPVIVQEAFASGVPVIATQVGALAELIEDGVNGYLCNPLSIEELANAVVRLASDAALRRRFSGAARSAAERRFRPDAGIGQLQAVLKDLDQNRSGEDVETYRTGRVATKRRRAKLNS